MLATGDMVMMSARDGGAMAFVAEAADTIALAPLA
jgi:hypothetical protein